MAKLESRCTFFLSVKVLLSSFLQALPIEVADAECSFESIKGAREAEDSP